MFVSGKVSTYHNQAYRAVEKLLLAQFRKKCLETKQINVTLQSQAPKNIVKLASFFQTIHVLLASINFVKLTSITHEGPLKNKRCKLAIITNLGVLLTGNYQTRV